ncbi:MAG: hypothetical protein R3C56_22520 [Pirellulaceae bacterium]
MRFMMPEQPVLRGLEEKVAAGSDFCTPLQGNFLAAHDNRKKRQTFDQGGRDDHQNLDQCRTILVDARPTRRIPLAYQYLWQHPNTAASNLVWGGINVITVSWAAAGAAKCRSRPTVHMAVRAALITEVSSKNERLV